MNKKILVSLSIVGVVAAAIVGITVAYFNDTETSQDNIFVAGTLDLKVDHLKQTYNDADCKTCSVVLISDPTNMVVEKNDVAITPYSALFVGSLPPYFIHSAWTAEEDPTLAAAGAKWIWATDPTTAEDALNGAIYRFKKTFEWWGPVTGSDLWFAVGSDNGVEVWLNGNKIGENLGQYGYLQGSMLHIAGAVITANVIQGENILEFRVNNWPWPNGTYSSNPGGLIYKFEIDGLCGDEYFKTHCKLWGLKDLVEGDTFWNFDDIKPGDHGTNVISLHPKSNDGWACLSILNKQDDDNGLTEPEGDAGDTTGGLGEGELSHYLSTFVWWDTNQNGVFDLGEIGIDNGDFKTVNMLALADSLHLPKLIGDQTMYLGWAWCAGTWLNVPMPGEPFICDGSEMDNKTQTDSFKADLEFYLEQWRNNLDFKCSDLGGGGEVEGCTTVADCDDNDACTIEAGCENGECTYQEQPCGDGNTCTIDSCDPIQGCIHTPYTCGTGTCDGLGGCTPQ